jgi:hypothetical protein
MKVQLNILWISELYLIPFLSKNQVFGCDIESLKIKIRVNSGLRCINISIKMKTQFNMLLISLVFLLFGTTYSEKNPEAKY